MSWLIYAVMASALVGLTNVLCEMLFRQVSFPTYLSIASAVMTAVFGVWAWRSRLLVPDLKILATNSTAAWLFVAAIVGWTATELCICSAIRDKNAVLAGFVEISFPLFAIFFSMALTGHSRLTPQVALGGALVFAGVAIIGYAET